MKGNEQFWYAMHGIIEHAPGGGGQLTAELAWLKNSSVGHTKIVHTFSRKLAITTTPPSPRSMLYLHKNKE